MEGYFLEPATDYDKAKTEGSDTAIMSGTYEVIPQIEMKKRIAKRKNVKEESITLKYDWYIDNPPGRSGIAIHGGKSGENTTGCFIPGNSFEFNEQELDYRINSVEKKRELFKFIENYGGNGIKIKATI